MCGQDTQVNEPCVGTGGRERGRCAGGSGSLFDPSAQQQMAEPLCSDGVINRDSAPYV